MVAGYIFWILHPSNRDGFALFGNMSHWAFVSLQVQVIPWVISDSNYVIKNSEKLNNDTTVFVGALHGMLNAEALAKVMGDLFGEVNYAGVDTDKYKYPIGECFQTKLLA